MTSSYAEKFLLKNLINLNMALVNVVSAGIELQMHRVELRSPVLWLIRGQVHNAEPAELAELAESFFREIKFRVLSLRYRAKDQNAELAELDLNFIK